MAELMPAAMDCQPAEPEPQIWPQISRTGAGSSWRKIQGPPTISAAGPDGWVGLGEQGLMGYVDGQCPIGEQY